MNRNLEGDGKRFAIATLGCKVNQFESAGMVEKLLANGWQQVPFNQQADLYLINSCTVTARSDAETRKLIRRAKRTNSAAKVVATGCYAQVAAEGLATMPELDQLLGNEEKREILQHLAAGVSQVSDLSETGGAASLQLTSFTEHTRAFLQIQNGCNSGCSYCIVPAARGSSRSARGDDILDAIARLVDTGFKEVVLTGIHLGDYRDPQQPEVELAGLLTKIEKQGLLPRLRLGSIEPLELTDQLLELFAGSTRFCPHLHIPLQSGSDSILKQMGRNYNTTLYRNRIETAVKLLPDCFIAADLIAGFPGESEQQFMESCNFVNSLPLADLHIFPYSIRPGTKAAEMPGHLKPAIIKARGERLRLIAADKLHRFKQRFIGKLLPVLGQQPLPDEKMSGLSRNYLDVIYPAAAEMKNREVTVLVTGMEKEGLTGEIVT